jgi:hypothetical protein
MRWMFSGRHPIFNFGNTGNLGNFPSLVAFGSLNVKLWSVVLRATGEEGLGTDTGGISAVPSLAG